MCRHGNAAAQRRPDARRHTRKWDAHARTHIEKGRGGRRGGQEGREGGRGGDSEYIHLFRPPLADNLEKCCFVETPSATFSRVSEATWASSQTELLAREQGRNRVSKGGKARESAHLLARFTRPPDVDVAKWLEPFSIIQW